VHKTTLLVCLALAALASCSHDRPLSRDELQSKLISAESLASETNTFLQFVRQGRATDPYSNGHIEYLSLEIGRIAKELHEAHPPADAEPQYRKGLSQVDALAAELNQLRGRIQRRDELAHDQEQIAGIRDTLQQAVSSL